MRSRGDRKDSAKRLSLSVFFTSLAAVAAIASVVWMQFEDNQELQRLTAAPHVLVDLEQALRAAASDPVAMKLSANRDSTIANCLNHDDRICQAENTPVEIYGVAQNHSDANGKLLTGMYSSKGEPCRAACPIEVQTKLKAGCAEGDSCDKARFLHTFYEIKVEGAVFRKGVVTFRIPVGDSADLNVSCTLGKDGYPRFASRIHPRFLGCQSVPRPDRKLVGVKAGRCQRGSEVMVGIDPKTKRPQCVKVKFTQ